MAKNVAQRIKRRRELKLAFVTSTGGASVKSGRTRSPQSPDFAEIRLLIKSVSQSDHNSRGTNRTPGTSLISSYEDGDSGGELRRPQTCIGRLHNLRSSKLGTVGSPLTASPLLRPVVTHSRDLRSVLLCYSIFRCSGTTVLQGLQHIGNQPGLQNRAGTQVNFRFTGLFCLFGRGVTCKNKPHLRKWRDVIYFHLSSGGTHSL